MSETGNFTPGEVIPYVAMCQAEAASLQRGMNFRLRGGSTVILMSVRRGAPYADRIEDEAKTLIYEGHDIPRSQSGPNPKTVNQVRALPSGKLTQNGLFYDAAMKSKNGDAAAESVRVYDKILAGVWAFAGTFNLVDAWQEKSGGRKVFKFKLTLNDAQLVTRSPEIEELPHNRLIPTHVKIEVWKRDKGKCVQCGSRDNLHFDHNIPFSLGGSSLVAKNIQLLCARHNLTKSAKII
jgi:hypothetical protein